VRGVLARVHPDEAGGTFAGWDLVGTWTIQAGVGYPKLQWEADLFPPSVATTIEKVSGDSQWGPVGPSWLLPNRTCEGPRRRPHGWAQVQFTVTAGGGTVEPASAATNASGLASTKLTLGPTLGLNQVQAATGGVSWSSLSTASPCPRRQRSRRSPATIKSAMVGSRPASR